MNVRSLFYPAVLFLFISHQAYGQNAWAPTSGTLKAPVTGISVDRKGNLFATNDDGLSRSTDDGASWTLLSGVNGPVFGFSSKGFMYAGGGKAVVRSADNGDHWSQIRIKPLDPVDPMVQGFAVNPTGTIYIATGSNGLFVSTSNGDSWLEQGVFQDIFTYPSFVACSPSGDVYATTAQLSARSTGIAQNWDQLTGSFGLGQTFAFAYNGDAIAAGSNGTFMSTNKGNTWTQIGQPDGSSDPLYQLAVGLNGTIYEGLSSDFSSANGLQRYDGQSWQPFITGLTNTRIHAIASSPNGHLFVATDNVVFESVDLLADVKGPSGSDAPGFSLGQNLPNPVESETVIPFTLPHAGWVSLKLYDVSGREIATLANNRYAEGSNSIPFNAKGLQAGSYYYVMQAEEHTQARMLVVAP
jgi:hypothetical protein